VLIEVSPCEPPKSPNGHRLAVLSENLAGKAAEWNQTIDERAIHLPDVGCVFGWISASSLKEHSVNPVVAAEAQGAGHDRDVESMERSFGKTRKECVSPEQPIESTVVTGRLHVRCEIVSRRSK
jgi:hypothetical protein